MLDTVLNYTFIFLQGLIIALLFDQLTIIDLSKKNILFLSILSFFDYNLWGGILYTIIFSFMINYFSRGKIPVLVSIFYTSYLLVSTAIIYQLLDDVLLLIYNSYNSNYTLMIIIELIFLPCAVFLLQTALIYYFRSYLIYFANNILAKYRNQAVIFDIVLLSYVFLRFSELENKSLIASVILGVLAAYIYFITLYSQGKEIELAKEAQLQNLLEYTLQIEKLYNELRHFKHDYKNILISLEYCLDHDDLAGVKEIYQNAIVPTKSVISLELQIIGQLQNIGDPALKGILSNKLSLALSKKLKVTCEVSEQIFLDSRISQLDMVRILSCLMDNAIEAACESSNKLLSVAFFEHNNEQIIIIRNSTKEKMIPLQSLNKSGFTTKKTGDHGHGLTNIRCILNNYPFITLTTSSNEYVFQQEITIAGGQP